MTGAPARIVSSRPAAGHIWMIVLALGLVIGALLWLIVGKI
ncbi:hypothetical protein [Roseiflexus castenholzii]|nr:hypothetical protein [Roseiflexus castenholzii]